MAFLSPAVRRLSLMRGNPMTFRPTFTVHLARQFSTEKDPGEGKADVEASEGVRVSPVGGVPLKEREFVDHVTSQYSSTDGNRQPLIKGTTPTAPEKAAPAPLGVKKGWPFEGVKVVVPGEDSVAAPKSSVSVLEATESRKPWDHVVPQFFTVDGRREGVIREKRQISGKGAPYDSVDLGGRRIRGLLRNIHDDIQRQPYGDAIPLPPAMEARTVLVDRCGAGRDAFAAAQLVGREGRVIGVEESDAELAVAQKWERWQATRFGYPDPNTTFAKGDIEQIDAESVDIVLSSGLSGPGWEKGYGLEQALRVLRRGGELFFTDVFTDRRLPKAMQEVRWDRGDPAVYIGDFARLAREMGVHSWGIVREAPFETQDHTLRRKLGDCKAFSVAIRVVKLPEEDCEDAPENYGQVALYNGGIKNHEDAFALDLARVFTAKKGTPVDGTTAAMLQQSRFSEYFTVSERLEHMGPLTESSWMQALPKQEVTEMELQDHLAAARQSDEPRDFSKIVHCYEGYAHSLSDPY